jgi:hypothetical protein
LNKARSQQNRLTQSRLDENGNDDGGSKFDAATVSHIQVVTSLIESRWVGLAEIFVMLDNILRQHSIDFAVKMPYGALCHQKTPP